MTRECYLGLMTGTVLDGEIDIAALYVSETGEIEFGPCGTQRYRTETCKKIRSAMEIATDWQFQGDEPEKFFETERALTEDQSAAVIAFCAENQLARDTIRAIGFHGQTVLHRAPRLSVTGATRQLGDGALMAQITKITTICDFRSNDVAHGGNGAPLAPVYHHALFKQKRLEDLCLLNLGGVGNLTWVPGGADMIAFDTGPANAPINDWVSSHGAKPFDAEGAIAATGTCDETRIQNALQHPYFDAPPPKSLDRNSFTSALVTGLTLKDGAATLTCFVAACVAKGLGLLPKKPKALIVSGGGRHNSFLMQEIVKRTGLDVKDAAVLGLDGDALEAQCFAYLAYRRLKNLPISFPGTTGAPRPLTGGVIHTT